MPDAHAALPASDATDPLAPEPDSDVANLDDPSEIDAVEIGEVEIGEVEIDAVEIDAVEEAFAQRRVSAIEAGRRKGGVAGAAMAGAMLAIQEIYEGPQVDEMVAVSESPDDPGDIDKDGIEVTVGDVGVWAPPPAPTISDDQST